MKVVPKQPENPTISWKITYQQTDSTVCIADLLPSFEMAVKFSLNLHESSNTPHSIYVMHDDIIDVVFKRD